MSKIKKQNVNILIVLIVLIGTSMCPEIGPMTKGDWFSFGAFLSVALTMIMGLPIWMGFIVTLYYCLVSKQGFETVFPGILNNSSVWLTLFIFWFLAAIKDSRLLEYITRKMLGTKLAKKGMYWLMSMFLITAFVVTALTQCCAAVIILLLVILNSTTEMLGLPKYHKWTLFTGIGIAAFSSFGQIVFPFNYVFGIYKSIISASTGVQAQNIQNNALFISVLCAAVVSFFVTLVLVKFVFKPDVSNSVLDTLQVQQLEFTPTMRGTLISIIVAFAIIILPSVTPGEWAVNGLFSRFGNTGAFGVAILINCFVKGEDGKPLFNFSTKMRDNTELWIFFVLGPLIYFGTIANAAGAGVPTVLSILFAPIKTINPYLLMCVLTMATILLSNIANNYVVCLITGPIGYSVFGFDTPIALCYTAMMMTAAFIAYATPTAGIQGVVIAGRNDMFKASELMKYGYVFAIFYGFAIMVTAFFINMF